jgi:magnesium chelatase subunit H
MANRLRNQNPEAFRNILSRMLEAKGRGFWAPSDDVLEKLQEMFDEVEDQIEGL